MAMATTLPSVSSVPASIGRPAVTSTPIVRVPSRKGISRTRGASSLTTNGGGASVVGANEPWFISGKPSDSHALNLPSGATATTAPFCIDETFTHLRVFDRNTGSLSAGQLKVEVLYYDSKGRLTSSRGYTQKSSSLNWVPSQDVPIEVLGSHAVGVSAPVAFRFSVVGNNASFQVDDVYVDPWARS